MPRARHERRRAHEGRATTPGVKRWSGILSSDAPAQGRRSAPASVAALPTGYWSGLCSNHYDAILVTTLTK